MSNKRVLLMYISINSGHHCASLAVEEAIRILDPEVEVLNVNSFNYTNPVLEKVISKTYISIIKNTPEVWDYLYDNPKVVKRTQKLRDLIHRFNSAKLKTLFDNFRPGVVACTQAFPCGMVADYKKTFGLNLPLIGILTDYSPHSYWIYDNINSFIVASGETMAKLELSGIPSHKIKTFGIPIDPNFKKSHNKEEICKKIGLEPHIPIILIMGGGQGLGPIQKIVKLLNLVEQPLQILVVTGTNKELSQSLQEKDNHFKKKVIILDYVDNIDELMEVSFLIITKPGGLTTAEALSKGLPMIIVHPIPGQEAKNTEFLLGKGVAVKADREKDVVGLVGHLLNAPEKVTAMRSQALEIGKPNAALDTAELILKHLSP